MILGQKSSLDLVQQSMEDELAADVFQEPIDKKIAVVEKVAEAVGLKLDIQAIETEVLQNVLSETSPIRMDPPKDIKHRIMKKKLNEIKHCQRHNGPEG